MAATAELSYRDYLYNRVWLESRVIVFLTHALRAVLGAQIQRYITQAKLRCRRRKRAWRACARDGPEGRPVQALALGGMHDGSGQ